MKKVFTSLFALLVFSLGSGVVFAERLSLEDAVQLLRDWENKANAELTAPGWTYLQYDSKVNESVEGYQYPYSHVSENWLHFNATGLVDTEIKYYRTEAEGRKLSLIQVDGFTMSYKDKVLRPESKDSPFSFGYGFAEELEESIDYSPGYEIQIEDVDYEGRKAVRMDLVIYFSPFEKGVIDELYQIDALGAYYRRWYDPETGLVLRSESYYMLTDRTTIWWHTLSNMKIRRPEALPKIVVQDLERTRSREFEKDGDYDIMQPYEPIIEEEVDPISDQRTIQRSVYSFSCPSFAFGNILVQNRVSFQLYPHIYFGLALSNASQSVSYLGGRFLGLREFCGNNLVTNHEVGGWGSGPTLTMTKKVSAS